MGMQTARSSTGSVSWGIRCDRCERWTYSPARSAAASAIRNAQSKGWIVADRDLCPACVSTLRRR